MEKTEIIFIEYDGLDRPFQVYMSDLTGYDFFYKNGELQYSWCSSNIKPFISRFAKLPRRKRKVWFKEEFRPTLGSDTKPLSDMEISKMGYNIIASPKHIEILRNYI